MDASDLIELRNQRGFIPRSALIAAGVPRGTLATWLKRSQLIAVLPRLYRLPEDALDFRRSSVLRFTHEDLQRPRYVALMILEALVERGW